MEEYSKRCRVCGHSKPLSEFHNKLDNKDKKACKCKKCHSAHMHDVYTAALVSGTHKAARSRYEAVNVEIMNKFRASGCIVCGERTLVCLDAHHVVPSKKDKYFANGLSIKHVGQHRLKKELEKCICLCANCHRKLHANIISIKDAVCPN